MGDAECAGVFEVTDGNAVMLAESLLEYGIVKPVLENDEGTPAPAPAPSPATPTPAKAPQPARPRSPRAVAAEKRVHDSRRDTVKAIREVAIDMGIDDPDGFTKKAVGAVMVISRKNPKVWDILARDESKVKQLAVNVAKKEPNLFNAILKSGGFERIGVDIKGDGTMAHAVPSNDERIGNDIERAAGIQVPDYVEVPGMFDVEPDDSEWEEAVITSFGYPMINLTSPLVRDMLRAADPKAQKRAYKEFKRQLSSSPDISNALGIGLGGTLGVRKNSQAGPERVKDSGIRTESVETPVVEGLGDKVKGAWTAAKDIASGRTFANPVAVLKSIANQKGTPCKRNPLLVKYEDIAGKSADEGGTVTVMPLTGNGKNSKLDVPASHLAAFYSVVDPKDGMKLYAKLLGEVKQNDFDAAKGKMERLKETVPFNKKAMMSNNSVNDNMRKLGTYIAKTGHPPFYILKARTEPREADRWSDDDAAHGYQMVTMVVDDHKAGMILKDSVAKALFRIG